MDLPALRVGLLAGEKIIPLLRAEHDGLFERYGVPARLQIMPSAAARDRALLAGDLDIALMNLVSVVIHTIGGIDLSVLTVITQDPGPVGMFQLVAGPGPVPRPATVGYSRGTITDYLASVLLDRAGHARDLQRMVDVPELVDRGRRLIAGSLDMAVLPAPLGEWCQDHGAVLLADDRDLAPPPPTLCMRTSVRRARRPAVELFLAAYGAGARRANADKPNARRVLDASHVPVGAGWVSPRFQERALPDAELVGRVVRWYAAVVPAAPPVDERAVCESILSGV